MALVCGLFCAHQAYAVQFVRIAPRQWRTPRNQASVNRFGIRPGCLFILERGQHFKFRRKFWVVFISVAQDSRQVFATVIWNILADPPQANVPHAANARRIQHLQKCFGAFTTKTDCKYLWHVITIADLIPDVPYIFCSDKYVFPIGKKSDKKQIKNSFCSRTGIIGYKTTQKYRFIFACWCTTGYSNY